MINCQAVFWDFDGVVLDSVHVKTRAFARMFSQYGPAIEKAVVEYHLENGGVSRYEKFKYYYNCLLNRQISEEELNELGEVFSNIALTEVLAAPYIAGALETLKELQNQNIPAYVVSGTPEKEVRDIVAERNIAHFFVEVHGSPRKKTDIICDILDRKRYSASECLFLGDAMTDFEAAKNTGVNFIGIVTESSRSPFPPNTLIYNNINAVNFSLSHH